MSTSVYPTTLDTFTNPAANNPRNSPSLAAGQTLQNDALVAVETKLGITGSAVTSTVDYKLSGVTGSDKASSKAGTETLTNKTLTAPAITSPVFSGDWDGWILNTDTWAYVSATTMTVNRDLTSILAKGDKIKLTNSTVKYFYIIANPTFGAGVTTITVTGGTDYTLANTAITGVSYSKMLSPNAFPIWFAFTPTYSGSGALGTSASSVAGKFKIDGNTLTVWTDCSMTLSGTADFGVYHTVPITPLSLTWPGNGYAQNSGGYSCRYDTSTSKVLWRKYDGSNFPNSGTTGFSSFISMQF